MGVQWVVNNLNRKRQMSINFDSNLHLLLNIVICTSFTFSTIILPFIIYLIINKSHQMKKYRYYMLNNVVCCYTFHVVLFFARPIALFPSFCIVMNPLITRFQKI
ncbi:hypothetical protein M3Y97_00667500 [Aphelenchoides bicaudatus]|nr:hypothetical protein M3Y97_00667500 [Aphelenchoides bicaudatus]